MDDTKRSEKYAAHLSQMIQFETVSTAEDLQPEKFAKFQQLLQQLFPALFKVAKYENLGGNMLLCWKGKDSSKAPVLFMNHQDVVEVQGDWKYPAFSGAIAEGKVWGRGALDTKGGLWGMLESANELAEEGFVPACDIYFSSSCREEVDAGEGTGAQLVVKTLEDRGVHFAWLLDEGGMVMYEPISGVKTNVAMVAMGERGCSTLKFTAKGNGGHASAPWFDTPLVRLGKFMAEADANKMFDVEISPVISEMLRRFAPYVGGALGFIYKNNKAFSGLLKKVMPKTGATARALLQTTIAFTMAEGSDGYNVIPAEASVYGNMRVSHHQSFAASVEAISKVAAKYGIETTIVEEAIESSMADYNSQGFKLIEAAVSAAFPGCITSPYIMTGCSDSRYFDKIADNCFRFVPFLISSEQMAGIHGINECVDVSTLAPAVDFYRFMMKGL